MAVGKKGSFATVSQAPVVDFATMIRNAQAEQSRIGKQEVAYVADYEKKKQEIAGNILELDPKEGHFKETQQILGEWFSQYQDLLAENEKNISEAKFGEMSLGQLRGISAGINAKVGKIKRNMDRLAQADLSLFKSNVSDGISSSVFNMFNSLHSGKNISGAGVDKDTLNPYMTYKDENGEVKMGLDKIIDFMYNPPKNIKYNEMVSSYGTAFKADKEKKRKGWLKDVTTQQLDDMHKNQIEDHVVKLLSDDKNFNSAVFNAFEEKDIHTLDELKDVIQTKMPQALEGIEELDDETAVGILTETLTNKMFRDVKNMFGETNEEDIKDTERRLSTEPIDTPTGEEKNFIVTGTPDLENQYQEVKGLYNVSNPEATEERVPTQGVEIIPNITGRFISGSDEKTGTFKDFAIESWFIDDNGKMVARGAKMEDLGTSSNLVALPSDADELTIDKARKKIPATTTRTSLVIDNTTEAGRVLVSAGLSQQEAQAEIERMKQLQKQGQIAPQTQPTNNQGGFNVDEFLKTKGLKAKK